MLSSSVTFPPTSDMTVVDGIMVQINNDTAVEGDQAFTVSIDSVSNSLVNVGSPSFIMVTISDADGK